MWKVQNSPIVLNGQERACSPTKGLSFEARVLLENLTPRTLKYDFKTVLVSDSILAFKHFSSKREGKYYKNLFLD